MNSKKLSTLLAQDISDPTDFPKDASSLKQLDAAVRCPICFDLFDGPVSLLCGHSFCSMCIRDVISTSSKALCPQCRQTATESQLRPNPAVEEVVSAWKAARPCILELAKSENEHERAASNSPTESPKKKRKLSPPPSSAGPSRTSSTESNTAAASSSVAKGTEKNPGPDSIVECPLCNQRMMYKRLNKHMDDNCPPLESTDATAKLKSPSSKSQKAQWSDILGGGRTKSKGKNKDDGYPLPKVSYDTLSDKQLKDKLVEQGLSTAGDRVVWTARYQRWCMLWNANLNKSASLQQSKPTLLKELKKWEDERQADLMKGKKTVTTDAASHLRAHSSEFKKLVAAARPKPAVANGPGAGIPAGEDIIVVDSDHEGDS